MKHLGLNPDPQHQPCLDSHVPSGAVLGIRIRIRIRMLLSLPDLHPDPFVISTDPDLDPSIIKQK
jgi:hypothetical protein